MQMPKKFRVAAASGLLLVTATALLLEHLRLISWEWSQGMVFFPRSRSARSRHTLNTVLRDPSSFLLTRSQPLG